MNKDTSIITAESNKVLIVCILRSTGIAASFVNGRSLTAGKIHFTGRQTCSLYLVLWLCDADYSTWSITVVFSRISSFFFSSLLTFFSIIFFFILLPQHLKRLHFYCFIQASQCYFSNSNNSNSLFTKNKKKIKK